MPWIIGGAALLGAGASMSAADKQAKAAGQAGNLAQQNYNMTRSDLSPWAGAGKASLAQLSKLLGLNNSGPDWQAYLNANPDVAASATYGTNPQQHYEDYGRKEGRQVSMMENQSNDPQFGSLLKPFGLEDFQESPAYQFNLSQGMEAINKSAAAKGKYYAPATLQDIGKYSQGLASNEFQNAFNNYNTGQNNIWNRLFGVSNAGQNAANQTGAFGQNAANAQGEAAMGAGNARASGLVGASNAISGGVGDAYNVYLMSQILGQRQTPTYSPYGAQNMYVGPPQ